MVKEERDGGDGGVVVVGCGATEGDDVGSPGLGRKEMNRERGSGEKNSW